MSNGVVVILRQSKRICQTIPGASVSFDRFSKPAEELIVMVAAKEAWFE
jgi:hypothetical protein